MTKSVITSAIDGGINIVPVVTPTIDAGQGGGGHTFEGADFENVCSPNSLVKYINIRLQAAIKSSESEFRPGWIEYGMVFFENEKNQPSTESGITSDFGTKTLGQMLKNFYRGHAIWTGCRGISVELPQCIDLPLKIPNKWCKNIRGGYWMFYYAFRSSKSTDTVTTVRFIYSHEYKLYI